MRCSAAMRRIHWSDLIVILCSAGTRLDSMTSGSESWPFSVRALTPHFGARISGVDVADDIPEPLLRALYRAFLRYEVLVFAPQELPPARQVAFGRRFGELQVHVMKQYHADSHPELYRLSNLDE